MSQDSKYIHKSPNVTLLLYHIVSSAKYSRVVFGKQCLGACPEVVYMIISASNKNSKGMAKIFQGVIFQLSRNLQIFLQNTEKEKVDDWRPSVICISETFFNRPVRV